MANINLGDLAKCRITGFRGVVMGRSEYLFNGRQLLLQSTTLSDGKPMDRVWFDEGELELDATAIAMGFKANGRIN